MKKVLFIILSIAAVAALIIIPQTSESAQIDVPDEAVVQQTQPAETPEPTQQPAPEETNLPHYMPDPTLPPTTSVDLVAVGDLMCLYGQLSAARKGGEYVFTQCFEQIAPIISEADIAMGNLETLVAESFPLTTSNKYETRTITPSDGSAPYTTSVRTSGSPKINAPESFLSAVADCGFDVLATANNHSFDRKHEGIVETMAQLDKYGIEHTGSYAQPEDKVPLIVSSNCVNIGVVSYTDISNQKPNKTTQAYMLDRYNEEKLTADIEAARQAGADFVIVYIHWGSENTHKVTSRQRKMAQFIADAGADFILGSHSHCTQEFEWIETQRGNVPVVYSLGNFVSSMGRTINKDSVVVCFTLTKDFATQTTIISQLSYIPTLCTATNAGQHIILSTNEEYANESPYASALAKSRNRTIDVLGETVAVPK